MIDILMATYNGGIYLENQLLSLIGQTFHQWKLVIHDDGSTDNTLEIINKYSFLDKRIQLINDNKKGLGPAGNFLHLLNFVTADYIIFCDQDDIWFENKLQILYEAIIKTPQNTPVAVYCNGYGYNTSTGIISNKVTWALPSTLQNALFLNAGVQGCSILFNKNLMKALFPLPDVIAMHDHVLTLSALTFGKFIYLDRSLMFYRQHEKNVTGSMAPSLYKRLIIFLKKIRSNSVLDFNHYLAVKSFHFRHIDKLSEKQKQIFEAYLSYPHKNLFKRIAIIIHNKFCIFNSVGLLLIKTVLLKPMNRK